MNYSDLCCNVRSIVLETARYIESEMKNNSRMTKEAKGKHDFVTYVDKRAEKMLVDSLSALLPDSGFIAEEGTSNKRGDKYNWVIDPVDGTTNFIHGLPPFAISVGLMENDEVVVGVIYEIGLHESFYAWKDSPAYLNGKIIKVTDTSSVSDSLIATGFPYTNYKYLDGFMESIRYFMKNSHGLRRLGSAATDIAYTACGRFDGFYEYGLHPWDVAAGSLILKQAGGRVGDFEGKPEYIFSEEIIAANSAVFDELQQIIRKLIR
ncbi:MAG: inositol monophosphatase family protein [Bacteroidota bacterium]